MADFSFGGEGVMQALQISNDRQEQALRREELSQEQALFPLQYEKAESDAEKSEFDARSSSLKWLKDTQAYQQSQVFTQHITDALKSGKLDKLTPQELDTTLSHFALEAGLPSDAADYAGKAASAAKDEESALKDKLANVGAMHEIVASHLDAVTDQASLVQQLRQIKSDLAQAGASPRLISSFDALAKRPWQWVKQNYSVRITNAQQQLETQLKSVQLRRAQIGAQKDQVELDKDTSDADVARMRDAFYIKNGYQPGSGGGLFGGTYAARFGQRVIGAATEGEAQLRTVARIGSGRSIWEQGIFKGGHVGASGKGTVSQLLTTAQQKMYSAAVAGFAPELAAAQNQGLAPSEAQINNVISQLSINETDSAQVGQFKLALLARDFRLALQGAEDNMTPAQKKSADALIKKFQDFPDPDVIANASPGDNMFPPGSFGAPGVQPTQQPKGGSVSLDQYLTSHGF